MYVMICTRHCVSYCLTKKSKYQSNPGEGHWTAVKNIHKYSKRTKDSFLVYEGNGKLVVKCYTNASFQTDIDDSVSQSGFMFFPNGGVVSWKSSKLEARYIAASDAANEVVWMRKFMMGLGVIPSITDSVDLYCNNNETITQTKEPRLLGNSTGVPCVLCEALAGFKGLNFAILFFWSSFRDI
ncbi:secreted RxLR effector protein 161-like [Apium graveolens]|uniref:secreted RxLR effector protein 161-like n=1 Tax=Apium graveolens TaxID=4045 RepID=UPI003D7A85C9